MHLETEKIMTGALIIVVSILFCLLMFGSPVIFAIGGAAMAYFIVKPGMWAMVPVYAHKFYTGMDLFVWLCIPLFITAGEVMSVIGLTDKLVKFAQIVVGRWKGGLAYVNVLDSMLFGGVSGSALADISGLGPIVIDMMKRDGYSAEFASALTVTTAVMGPVIPPSIPMIIFASLTDVSIGALFLGGIIPGILIGLGQAAVITFMIGPRHFPSHRIKDLTWKLAFKTTIDASWALIMPLIILGGIISGVFTATEAAAVAVAYAVLIGFLVYRNLSLKVFYRVIERAARTSASIYLIIGFITVISWVMANERVPDIVTQVVKNLHLETWQFLAFLNLFFLFNGLWLSDTVQLILFAPLFTPILANMGVHPIHFGVVMVVNVMIGMMTPPYGMALYLGAIVGKVSMVSIIREGFPFILSTIFVLFLITYIPFLVLWIPRMFGLVGN
jgi:tripartite ATP-independent transporter DctM subunit